MECWSHLVYFIEWCSTLLGRYLNMAPYSFCSFLFSSLESYLPLLSSSETEAGIFRQILQGPLDFESEPWPLISDSAKDLIRNMLNRDPKKRFTAHQVLCKYFSESNFTIYVQYQ